MKYREKLVYVQAEIFDGSEESTDRILAMAKPGDNIPVVRRDLGELHIYSNNSVRRITPGKWVIRKQDGQFIGCDPVAFESLYEEVAEHAV